MDLYNNSSMLLNLSYGVDRGNMAATFSQDNRSILDDGTFYYFLLIVELEAHIKFYSR